MPRELSITLDLGLLRQSMVRPTVLRFSATRFEVQVVLSLRGRNTRVAICTYWPRGTSGNARDRRRARRRTDRAIAMLAKHGAVLWKGSWVR